MSLCTHLYMMLVSSVIRGIKPPEAGVTGSCDPAGGGAGNQAKVLWKRAVHVSNPFTYVFYSTGICYIVFSLWECFFVSFRKFVCVVLGTEYRTS